MNPSTTNENVEHLETNPREHIMRIQERILKAFDKLDFGCGSRNCRLVCGKFSSLDIPCLCDPQCTAAMLACIAEDISKLDENWNPK